MYSRFGSNKNQSCQSPPYVLGIVLGAFPTYTLNNQGPFFHCLRCWLHLEMLVYICHWAFRFHEAWASYKWPYKWVNRDYNPTYNPLEMASIYVCKKYIYIYITYIYNICHTYIYIYVPWGHWMGPIFGGSNLMLKSMVALRDLSEKWCIVWVGFI